MRYVVLICVALLVPWRAFATECSSDCTFIRGDANCSNAVDGYDVSAIQNSTYTNADAADVDDNGTVNGSDVTRLSYYLYYGNPAWQPACPFPSRGKDCTADSLENCCSPPTGATSPTYPTCSTSIDNHDDTWDHKTEDDGTIGSFCYGYGRVYNDGGENGGCHHESSFADMHVGALANDASGFTKKRLANQIQKAMLHLDIEVTFEHGARCVDAECEDANVLNATIEPDDFGVIIHWAPAGGGTGASYMYDEFDEELSYTYWREQPQGMSCTITTWDDAHVQIVPEPIDISSHLAAVLTSDCTVYKIDQVTAVNLPMEFIRVEFLSFPDDIAEEEEIVVIMQAWVEYEWCTCS